MKSLMSTEVSKIPKWLTESMFQTNNKVMGMLKAEELRPEEKNG